VSLSICRSVYLSFCFIFCPSVSYLFVWAFHLIHNVPLFVCVSCLFVCLFVCVFAFARSWVYSRVCGHKFACVV